MPSFDALAGAALTPGGVQGGLNDLVSALVQAPIERRKIEMQQAAQMAQQEQAQQDFGLRQSDLMGRQQNDVHRNEQDASQFDSRLAFDKEAEQRRAQEAVLQFYGTQARAGGHAGQSDALTKLLPQSPKYDPATLETIPPDQRVKYAKDIQDQLALANGAAEAFGHGGQGGIIPVGKALPGGTTTDPQAQMVIDALLKSQGLGGMPGIQGGSAPSPATSPQTGSEPATPQPDQPAAKTASLQEVQAQAAQSGYTLQEAIEYYKSLGYTVQ